MDIIIPENIIRGIADSEADFCKRVRKCDPIEAVRNLASGYKGAMVLLRRYFEFEELRSSKILEIGSGNGFFLCYALKSGLNITGIEPGKTYGFEGRYSRACELLKLNGFNEPEKYLIDASIEDVPFENDSFDIVVSIAVLEHVQNLDLALKESIRVLKPSGTLLNNIPNYNSIYEGHYDIFWIPYMNKTLAKNYVRKLFDRDPYLMDELIFTTPVMFRKYLNNSETYGKLFLRGVGVFDRVFEAYNYLDEHFLVEPSSNSLLKRHLIWLLRNKLFKFCVKIPLWLLVNFFTLLGLATTFDLVLNKREAIGSKEME